MESENIVFLMQILMAHLTVWHGINLHSPALCPFASHHLGPAVIHLSLWAPTRGQNCIFHSCDIVRKACVIACTLRGNPNPFDLRAMPCLHATKRLTGVTALSAAISTRALLKHSFLAKLRRKTKLLVIIHHLQLACLHVATIPPPGT